MKFDLHLNVGKVYRTEKPGSVEMYYTGKEIAEYCNYYGITHGVCIYDKYENFKELIDNTDAKIYGVQWVISHEQDLDVNNPERAFEAGGCYGIKLHSHRGYRDGREYDWKHPNKKRSKQEHEKLVEKGEETRSFGSNYADKWITEILEQLPDNALVYMHSQGWPSLDNRARPEHLFMLATEFFNLKFIMGHAGGYGAMTAALPGNHVPPTERKKGHHLYKVSIRNYGDSVTQFNASVRYANLVHNLFLDSSCYTPDKAIALRDTTKWCVGSDYPFGANKPRNSEGNDDANHWGPADFDRPYVWNFHKQAQLFANAMGWDAVNAGYKECDRYITTPNKVLVQEQYEKIQELKAEVKAEKDYYADPKAKKPTKKRAKKAPVDKVVANVETEAELDAPTVKGSEEVVEEKPVKKVKKEKPKKDDTPAWMKVVSIEV